jgi:hypothetical protein
MHVSSQQIDTSQERIRVGTNRLQSVQQKVSNGEYQVDCQLVATAMLERIGATISDGQVVSERDGGRVLLQALSGLRAA